jgi:hypothetical protein
MADWYRDNLGMRTVHLAPNKDLAILGDPESVGDRPVWLTMATPSTPLEMAVFKRHGYSIAGLTYQALDVAGAYEDGIASGLVGAAEPAMDPRTGLLTAHLREPNGNLLEIRAALAA